MFKTKIITITITVLILTGLFVYSNTEKNNNINYNKEIQNNNLELKENPRKIKKPLSTTENSNIYKIKICGGLKGKIKVRMVKGVGINAGKWIVISKPFFHDEKHIVDGEFIAGNGLDYYNSINCIGLFGRITVKVMIGSQSTSRSGIILLGFKIFIL